MNHDLLHLKPSYSADNQEKYPMQWMMIAFMIKDASYAVRKKVGACIVTPSMGVYVGYNGTAPGDDNCCEIKDNAKFWPGGGFELITKPTVIHAEQNALDKMLKEGVSAHGSVIYQTYSPCLQCAMRVANSGVKSLYYLEAYRDLTGVDYLKNRGVNVMSWEEVLGRPFEPTNY